MSYLCPFCRQPLRADHCIGGQVVTCPKCRKQIEMPQTAELPSPSPRPRRGSGVLNASSGDISIMSSGRKQVIFLVAAFAVALAGCVFLAEVGPDWWSIWTLRYFGYGLCFVFTGACIFVWYLVYVWCNGKRTLWIRATCIQVVSRSGKVIGQIPFDNIDRFGLTTLSTVRLLGSMSCLAIWLRDRRRRDTFWPGYNWFTAWLTRLIYGFDLDIGLDWACSPKSLLSQLTDKYQEYRPNMV